MLLLCIFLLPECFTIRYYRERSTTRRLCQDIAANAKSGYIWLKNKLRQKKKLVVVIFFAIMLLLVKE